MHRKKHSVYRIRDDPQFKASSGSLGTYPPQTMSHSGVRINTYAARVENHWFSIAKGLNSRADTEELIGRAGGFTSISYYSLWDTLVLKASGRFA